MKIKKSQRKKIYFEMAEYFLSGHNEFISAYIQKKGYGSLFQHFPELNLCISGYSTSTIYWSGRLRGMLCLLAHEMCNNN